MGSLTAKVSGEIASFMSPSVTNIKSLKIHFSPKQLGTGDPSPENIREIEGWDGIKIQFYNPITNLYVAKEQTISAFGLTFHVSEQNQNITINGTVSGVEGRRVNLFAIDGDNSTVFCSGFPKLTGKLSWSLLLDNDIVVDSLQDINGFSYQVETNKKLRFGIKIYSGEILSLDIHPIITKASPISVDFNNTFYGGYVDLISGELVETIKMVQFTWGECEDSAILGDTERRDITFENVTFKKIGEQKVKISNIYSNFEDSTAYWNVDEVACMFANSIIMCKLPINSDDNTIIQIAGELATPITRQLTPTQLKSFVGQNNFWSNADYVEIEYDLIETIDIQKAKQKIILNQPQLKTISDKVVIFNTDMVAPMKNCKIYFKPIQLGTGDAFYTNVKNINGWTSIDSYVNGDKVSVDWTNDAGIIYGGYLDLAKNEVVAEWIKYVFNRSSTVSSSGTSSLVEGLTWMTLRKTITSTPPYMATPNNGDSYGFFTIGDWRKAAVGGKNRAFVNSKNLDVVLVSINGEDLTTSEGRNTFFNYIENNEIPIECVYKLATPIHYPLSSLTSQQLLTLKSTNHIWSETNGQQIDVKYWTHKNLTPTPLTNYLENQTWSSNGYISATGKQTPDANSASHYLASPILLEAGTYVLSGFSHYVGTDNTNYRIHAYDSTGTWLRQITYKQIGNLSPVDISFTLDTDTYVNVSIAADFDGVLAKIN